MILYTAIEKYNNSLESWDDYKKWIKLPHLIEVISLDGMLNPCPIEIEYSDAEEFKYVHFEEGDQILKEIFNSLDFVEEKVKKLTLDFHIIALEKEPQVNPAEIELEGFTFVGFDLVDETSAISALTNCGGFYETYSPEDLNKYGLLSDFKTVYKVRDKLLKNNPHEPHADCDVWALWTKEN